MTDVFDQRESLSRIRDYARERQVGPWAVLGGVFQRVCAETGPGVVMLPPTIGSPKPLNLAVISVGPSGFGKTAADDVAEQYWPTSTPVYPLGTAEGAVQAFDPDEDGQPQQPDVIFTSSEIDNWAALGERAGSLTFPVLRQMMTGDQIGQKNASKAHSRMVNKRTYCAQLALGAQPGSRGTATLIADAAGGFPQRCLFTSVLDPEAPDDLPSGVHVLRPPRPEIVPDRDSGYHFVAFPDVATTLVREHRKRVLRGDPTADPLDGHRNLTWCKIAAALALLEGRLTVTDEDWRLAGAVMDISDATRTALIAAARQAARDTNRAKALASADRDEVVETTKLQRTKHTLLKHLDRQQQMPRHDLRKRLRSDQRQHFDAAITELIDDGQVFAVDGENSTTYQVVPDSGRVSTWTESPPLKPQLNQGGPDVHVDSGSNVTTLDSRRSHDSGPPKLSCQKWFDAHIAALIASGETTASSFAVYAAGQAEGYTRQQLRTAASTHPDVTVIDRTGGKATWSIDGTAQTPYRSALEWVNGYLDKLTPGTEIDKDRFRQAGAAAGHSWTATRRGATESGRIESVRGEGLETVWVVKPDRAEEDAS
ncbi:hypothetical protein FIV07_02000 [Mycobacterium sp. THAF192]|nr:hypothetical protein FIV07_02000 [Mycobacterium sp. THAF192]